jgi:hypothetical protein
MTETICKFCQLDNEARPPFGDPNGDQYLRLCTKLSTKLVHETVNCIARSELQLQSASKFDAGRTEMIQLISVLDKKLNLFEKSERFKGTLTRDFRPLVFFIKQLPLGP